MRTVRVALAGLGNVGRETVRLLRANEQRFQERLGLSVRIEAVADRDVAREARRLGLPASVRRARDPQDLLRPGVDAVVELLGGLEAPRRLVLAALERGLPVVTANKRLLSHEWAEFQRACAWKGGRLYFEASVAGGIPLLQALDEGFAADRIEAVHGILNGTTNFILTRAEAGASMEDALREAQRLGLAEKDPSADLSGEDTAQKVSVLASLLTGAHLNPAKIDREGIEKVSAEDIVFARFLGKAVRLLGVLKVDWDGGSAKVEAHVHPAMVPLDHPLASVRGEYNAALVKTVPGGDFMFYGKGAGPGPTASAVVSDVYRLGRDLGGAPKPPRRASRIELAAAEESRSAYYLRLQAVDKPGVLARVTSALGRRGVSIASIHQSEGRRRGGVPLVIATHPTTAGRFRGAVADLGRLGGLARPRAVLRLLDS